MKKLILIVGVLLLGAPTVFAQNGHDLFQKALQKERAEGKLEEAIALYARIVEEHASDRALVARALVQMGQDYERLGQADNARRAFEQVLNEYADQAEAARLARAKVVVAAPAIEQENSGLVTRRILADLQGTPFVSPSPDGALLAYPNWDTGDLAIEDLASGEVRSLTGNEAPYYPGMAIASVFSPDGKQIAYNWTDYSIEGPDIWDLRIVNADGSGGHVLSPRNGAAPYIHPKDWSPDGKYILAVQARQDQTTPIVLISTEDASVRVLKSLNWDGPLAMRFSRDGRYVAYDRPQEEGSQARDVYLLAVDGSRETVLVEHPANDYLAGWTADGKHLLFISDRGGAPGAWLLRVEDGKPQGPPILVKGDLWGMTPVGITREGAFLYDVLTASPAIYVADVDPETGVVNNERSLTRLDVAIPNALDWSPDGQHLAYRVMRGPFAAGGLAPQYMMIHSLATGSVRQLDIQPQLRYLQSFQWSPDDRTLFLTGQDRKGRQHLYRVDSETGQAASLFRMDEDVTLLWEEPSSDGSEVFFREISEQQEERVIARSLASGTQRTLYQAPYHGSVLSDLTLSPDGHSLAFLLYGPKEKANRIMIVPAGGGDVREIARFVEEGGIFLLTWTPSGDALWYLRKTANGDAERQVWHIPVDGRGEPQALALKREGLQAIRFRQSGKQIAYIAGAEKHELWVMEDFLPNDEGTK